MKLLALPTSPFCARVLIQVFEKKLDLEVVYPPPGRDVGEHAAPNPFGKIPVLLLPQGFIIESAAIGEYLEDMYPEPPLRPHEPLQAARVRAFVRAVDHYLFPVLFELRTLDGKATGLDRQLDTLDGTLSALQKLMDGDQYACREGLSLADCALVPACFFLERFLNSLGQASVFDGRPRLAEWWEATHRHESVARVMGGLEEATRPP